MRHFFSSESVTEGHPDKVCDRISDAVLDALIAKDPMSRVACESFCTTDFMAVMGEITSSADVDIEKIARETVKEIGYDRDDMGFNAETCQFICKLDKQSSDISMGVSSAYEQKNGETDAMFSTGAGDQGIIFGYACNETKELMPLPISLAHKLARRLTEARKNNELTYLRPDGKTQVTVEYDDGKPVRIDTVVVSTQHADTVDIEQLREDIKRVVILPTIDKDMIDENTKFFINPTGRFVIGGPHGDSGLTGRKIIVDTYGGYSRHGGGAFSGKDPTKVDRSAAYYARYIAKNIVASGAADKCEIQLAYAIGVAKPVSILVETFGTAKVDQEKIAKAVENIFDARPDAIISALELRKPQYKNLASLGHMGREELGVKWENTDKVEQIKKFLQI